MASKKGTKKATTKSKSAKKQIDAIEQVETPTETQSDVQPSAGAYVRATVQLLSSWIKTHKLRTLVIFAVVLIVVAGAIFLLRPGTEPLTNDEIVTQINRELSISGDGNPAVLTVVDDQKVEQPFLEQAENGDKVVLYYKAKKAVLFRPSENRIVHQGTYTPPEAKVFIRNGTNDVAVVENLKQQLDEVEGIDIVSEDVSAKRDYKGITLVSVTDRYDEVIRELETVLSTKVVRLPAGESFPDADILIIAGS